MGRGLNLRVTVSMDSCYVRQTERSEACTRTCFLRLAGREGDEVSGRSVLGSLRESRLVRCEDLLAGLGIFFFLVLPGYHRSMRFSRSNILSWMRWCVGCGQRGRPLVAGESQGSPLFCDRCNTGDLESAAGCWGSWDRRARQTNVMAEMDFGRAVARVGGGLLTFVSWLWPQANLICQKALFN